MANYIKNIDGNWYAFAADENTDQVYSIGKDNPDAETGGNRWYSRWTDAGIKYVASPVKTKAAAVARCMRAGGYDGEI